MQIVDQGVPYEFSILSGVVLGTDQRSDTYVSGGGSTTVINGNGGGSSWVSSSVVVVRDIFFKDAGGQEHHVRFNKDVAVRPGHLISVTTIQSRGLRDKNAKYYYSLINHSTNEVYYFLEDTSKYKTFSYKFLFVYLMIVALTVKNFVHVAALHPGLALMAPPAAMLVTFIVHGNMVVHKKNRILALHRQVIQESNKDFAILRDVYLPKPDVVSGTTEAA